MFPASKKSEIIDLASEETELSLYDLAIRFIDTKELFVSNASVYRLLKFHDLITSHSSVRIKSVNEFKDKPTRVLDSVLCG